MIVILDTQTGNLRSIYNMLKYLEIPSVISKEDSVIEKASHLILGGVASWDFLVSKLKHDINFRLLQRKVFWDKVNLLGICAGFQVLFNSSEEGTTKGLGFLNGEVMKFRNVVTPHMGWNQVIPYQSKLLKGLEQPRFYFVHSYYVVPDSNYQFSITKYNNIPFVSVVEFHNIFGVQFHPEKSHKFGMKLLSNFWSM